jgi:hypothetical protein
MARQQPWAYERGILYGIDLPAEIPVCRPRVAAVFKEIGPDSAEPLAAAMGVSDSTAISLRFSSRRRCFAAWCEDRIAAYGWVSQTSECIGEQERVIQLEPHEAYIWDCATLKAFRGQRLYSALLSHMIVSLGNEGVQRIWIGTAMTNTPSLGGFANAGFLPALTVVFARLFSIRCVITVGHSRGGKSLASAARRALLSDEEHAWGPVFVGRARTQLSPPCAEVEA